MDPALANALARRKDLLAEIERIDAFVKMYREFSGTNSDQVKRAGENAVPTSATREGTGTRVKNSPAIIANAAETALRRAGRPMQRGEIVEAIEASGIEIKSDDKPRYLGTILWRNSDRFVSGDGGYWLKHEPIPTEESRARDKRLENEQI